MHLSSNHGIWKINFYDLQLLIGRDYSPYNPIVGLGIQRFIEPVYTAKDGNIWQGGNILWSFGARKKYKLNEALRRGV